MQAKKTMEGHAPDLVRIVTSKIAKSHDQDLAQITSFRSYSELLEVNCFT